MHTSFGAVPGRPDQPKPIADPQPIATNFFLTTIAN
jgi:hypothetical protein